jgi:hypothetical protein
MNNRCCCSPWGAPVRAIKISMLRWCALISLLILPRLVLADAPPWMHAAASAPLPAHDEKTNAVLLYEERNVTVQSADKIKTQVRVVYKILRPGGREYGIVHASFHWGEKINNLHGWCIPVQGKDYEVKDKEAVEIALPHVEGSDLVNDVRTKLLQIPAADPGAVVGYEYEMEEQPLVLQDVWYVQREVPVRESHFNLQLPPGWAYKASWLNYTEIKPTEAGSQIQWSVTDVQAIREESQMPPFDGITGQMILSYFPQGGTSPKVFTSWKEMGSWYETLISGRRDASSQIKQQVSALTASATTQLEKMRALAQFVQNQIRYVAIELGIGGFQPHAAPEVFSHRYGDCKDKATLMSSMLSQIGVDSYYVVINSERGSVTAQTPANAYTFDHVVLAIKLPAGVQETFSASVQHPKLGTLLYFDPTDELTPLGQISGSLQANYGLLVTPDGGELVELPRQPSSMNSVQRTGKLALDPAGTLTGEVTEMRLGDRAWAERWRIRNVTKDSDRIKPVEDVLAGSLSLFQITKASMLNFNQTDKPFGFQYAFEAPNYAKDAGGLLLVRPRVLGVKASPIMETKEPRKFPVEFEGPSRDTDVFDITIPAGYMVDDVPPPVDADYDFASYHAKTEVQGNVIHYTRTFEVKELSVPVVRTGDLKTFYRIIAGDERNTVILKSPPRP